VGEPLDEFAFWANGKKYNFNADLGNVRGDTPIHGFLSSTDKWKVVEVKADKNQAWVRAVSTFTNTGNSWGSFPSHTRST